MSDWQRTLDIKDIWEQAKNKEISTKSLAKIMIKRLEALNDFGIASVDEGKQALMDEFFELSEYEEGVSFYDFDIVMGRLYDWADTSLGGKFPDVKKICWIKTQF